MKVNKFSILWQIVRTEVRSIKVTDEKLEYVIEFLNSHPNKFNYARVMNWAKMLQIGYSSASEQHKIVDDFVKYLTNCAEDYTDTEDDSNDLTQISTEKLQMVLDDLELRKYGFQFKQVPKAHIEFVEKLKQELKRRTSYTTEEIKNYLEGGLYVQLTNRVLENCALNNLIAELEDDEDGIEAVTKRNRERKNNEKEKQITV